VSACSKISSAESHSSDTPQHTADSGAASARLEKIQKDYGVTVNIHDHYITIVTGLITTNRMSQINDALRKVLGEGFTNYTVNYNIF
jgi:hypothetical protein